MNLCVLIEWMYVLVTFQLLSKCRDECFVKYFMGITASFVFGLHKEIVKFMSLHYAARIRPIPDTPGERDEAQHWHQAVKCK